MLKKLNKYLKIKLSEPFKEEAIAIIERRRHFSEGPGSEKVRRLTEDGELLKKI